jgi:hypothetical protein
VIRVATRTASGADRGANADQRHRADSAVRGSAVAAALLSVATPRRPSIGHECKVEGNGRTKPTTAASANTAREAANVPAQQLLPHAGATTAHMASHPVGGRQRSGEEWRRSSTSRHPPRAGGGQTRTTTKVQQKAGSSHIATDQPAERTHASTAARAERERHPSGAQRNRAGGAGWRLGPGR